MEEVLTDDPSVPVAGVPAGELWRVRLLDEFEVARLLRVKVGVLRRRRARGLPPVFVRISGQIRYRLADLAAFVEGMQNSPRQGVERVLDPNGQMGEGSEAMVSE